MAVSGMGVHPQVKRLLRLVGEHRGAASDGVRVATNAISTLRYERTTALRSTPYRTTRRGLGNSVAIALGSRASAWRLLAQPGRMGIDGDDTEKKAVDRAFERLADPESLSPCLGSTGRE
jgi:hypothetical protein